MTAEFVYQNTYESTIDALALRENVKKILENASIKSSVVKSADDKTEKNTSVLLDEMEQFAVQNANQVHINKELKSTFKFLNSSSALKLLNLTQKTRAEYSDSEAEIVDFKIDESKKNIFAA